MARVDQLEAAVGFFRELDTRDTAEKYAALGADLINLVENASPDLRKRHGLVVEPTDWGQQISWDRDRTHLMLLRYKGEADTYLLGAVTTEADSDTSNVVAYVFGNSSVVQGLTLMAKYNKASTIREFLRLSVEQDRVTRDGERMKKRPITGALKLGFERTLFSIAERPAN